MAIFCRIYILEMSNQFIDLQATERAVLILQYLVDATTEIPEHLLPLNKFLCGLDLAEPVPSDLVMSQVEQDECNELLISVIQTWSILGSTSVDGLRRAFLQRAGILHPRDSSWLLQVEHQTYDIVLDQLPWSIRVIRLPWMDKLLHIDW